MQKIFMIILVASSGFSQLSSMEIVNVSQQKDVGDYFSQLPNVIRRRIILPLLSNDTNYAEAKKTLLCVGLVSKKSYEQINCIFFVKDVVSLLSDTWKVSRGKVAIRLNTAGVRHYEYLSNLLCFLAVCYPTLRETRHHLHSLLIRGADVN